MTHRAFELRPYHPDSPGPGLLNTQLTGTIERTKSQLTLQYRLTGPLSQWMIPKPVPVPLRQDNLWQQTCFEFFITTPEAAPYWEFNLSPSGHWQVYSFTTYRQGMQPEPGIQDLPIILSQDFDSLVLTLTCDVSAIIPDPQPLNIAISAVLQSQTGSLSYWALTHPAPEADFHHRDSFIVHL